MFDVLWTDPNVELMGQRMIRKEQEAKEREQRRAEFVRQSVSTNSSSCSSERGFNLFAKGRGKSAAPSRGKQNASTQGQERSGIDGIKTNRSSAYGVNAALGEQDELEIRPNPSGGLLPPIDHSDPVDALPQLPRDGTISPLSNQEADATCMTDRTMINDATPQTKTEAYVQDFGPSSSITQVIKTEITPRTESDSDQPQVETHISCDVTDSHVSPLAEVPEEMTPNESEDNEALSPPYILPRTPPAPETRSHELVGNAEVWRPPHEWDCTPTKKTTTDTSSEVLQASPTCSQVDYSVFPAFRALQRERRMMATASPELMLASLKAKMGNATDGSVYKGLEMAKKRWMFSVLQQQGGYGHLIGQPSERPSTPPTPKQTQILALYETHASVSFLVSLYPMASITHLSANPLSPDVYPNIRPLQVPSVSVSASSRALAPQLYSTVTCLSMPALFPSTDIPPFLRQINRCLTAGGALHLTIVDPQPVSTSMGPKLRQWLFAHLLINLEQAFRTTMPSETFPVWLAVANLRGKGSTIATITVPAVPESHGETEPRAELHCLANRLLWQEVWGKFVNASCWWWEEEEIVQECVDLGTYWHYSHIIAVKQERD